MALPHRIIVGVVLILLLSGVGNGQFLVTGAYADGSGVSETTVSDLDVTLTVEEQGNSAIFNTTLSNGGFDAVERVATSQNESVADIVALDLIGVELGLYATRSIEVHQRPTEVVVELMYTDFALNTHPNYRGTVENGTVNVQVLDPISGNERERISSTAYYLELPGGIVTTNAPGVDGDTAIWSENDTLPAVLAARSEFGSGSSPQINSQRETSPTNNTENNTSENGTGGTSTILQIGLAVGGALFIIVVPWLAYKFWQRNVSS